MVVTYKRFGRLGNRLFLFAHLIAFAERYGKALYFPAFNEFRASFPYFDDPLCPYIPVHAPEKEARRHPGKLFHVKALLSLIPKVRFWDDRDIVFDGEDEQDPRVRQMVDNECILFEGWKFRSHHTISSILPTLRTIFRPQEDINTSIEARLKTARSQSDVVVGIHLRWEDYRGTPFFFPLEVYLSNMKDISALFEPLKVSFLITSPEKLISSNFPENYILCSGGTAVHDMYTLAHCDYIMGPPSTFSGWASFYGGKPLFAMRNGILFDDVSKAEIIRW